MEQLRSLLNYTNAKLDNPQAKNVIRGALAMVDGDCDDAIRRLDRGRLSASKPVCGHPSASQELASQISQLRSLALVQMGLTKQAFNEIKQAVHAVPCDDLSWLLLGQLYEQRCEVNKAFQCYHRASLLSPQTDHGVLALVRLLERSRRWRLAIKFLDYSIQRDRRSAKLHRIKARLLERFAHSLRRSRQNERRCRLLELALQSYQVANASRPQAETYVSMGVLHQLLGQHEEAEASFRSALKMSPNHTAALNELANFEMEAGKLGEGTQRLKQVIELDPSRAVAHFRYSRSQKFANNPQTQRYLESLQCRLRSKNLRRVDEIHFRFALAKVYDDLGRNDEAWEMYLSANRLKSSGRAVSGKNRLHQLDRRLEKLIETQMEFFRSGRFQDLIAVGNSTNVPVFIVGMPRSGTTLTEQILSQHPEVAGAGELKDIEVLARRWSARLRQGRERSSASRLHRRRRLRKGLAERPIRSIPEEDLIPQLAQQYLDRVIAQYPGCQRISDKMPTNFWHLGLIATMFPAAKIIHCRRHPLDVFVSSICQNLSYPFCELDSLAVYYRHYQRIMQFWDETLPMPILHVDYEQTVSNTEIQARRIVRHCDLGWDDRCLTFTDNPRMVQTPSKWQVRQPIYRTSVEKWRRFEKHLQPLLDRNEFQQALASMG